MHVLFKDLSCFSKFCNNDSCRGILDSQLFSSIGNGFTLDNYVLDQFFSPLHDGMVTFVEIFALWTFLYRNFMVEQLFNIIESSNLESILIYL